MTWKPHVTVAAVIEHQGKYLCVEETIDNRRRLNQPAGHLEPGENLLAAVTREVREETRFEFSPRYLVGIYLWRQDDNGKTFLRLTFAGELGAEQSDRQLDTDIDAITWLTEEEVLDRRDEWRSPLVGQCIHDYRQGKRYPLDCLVDLIDKD